ncbi:hypothetical protein GCM10029964_094710 [Kibdelosporangium lantanae]
MDLAVADGFPDRLRAFDEEPAGPLSAGPPGQLPGSSDPGCALGEELLRPGSL